MGQWCREYAATTSVDFLLKLYFSCGYKILILLLVTSLDTRSSLLPPSPSASRRLQPPVHVYLLHHHRPKARFNVKWAGDDSGETAHMSVSDLPGAKIIRISAGQIDSGGIFAGFQVRGAAQRLNLES